MPHHLKYMPAHSAGTELRPSRAKRRICAICSQGLSSRLRRSTFCALVSFPICKSTDIWILCFCHTRPPTRSRGPLLNVILTTSNQLRAAELIGRRKDLCNMPRSLLQTVTFRPNAHGWRALLPAILFYPSQKVPSASSGQALRPLRGTQDDTNEKLFRNLSFVAELTNSFRILSFLFLWPCFRSARNAQTPAPVPA